MSTREEMLARVRRSLNRLEDAPAPVPLPPFATPVVSTSPDELVTRFAREMQSVGGSVTQLDRIEDACAYLDALYAGAEEPAIVVTSLLAERSPALARWTADHAPRASIDGEPDGGRGSGQGGELDGGPGGPDGGPMRDEARKARLLAAGVGVTGADYAIADTGTLVLVAGGERHRLLSLLPPVHVCVLPRDRIVANLPELLARVRCEEVEADLPLSITFITGPSRTADIELTLAHGVHGPREVHVLIVPSGTTSGD